MQSSISTNQIQRTASATVSRLLRGFPIVVVTGPRQAGKTTLVRAACPDKPYVSLEDPDVRLEADRDPRGFLRYYAGGAVFDEVQRCPQLLSYLQGIVDETGTPGQFVLTGSQQFGLLAGVTQSLAGRAGLCELLPFSLGELQAAGRAPPDVETLLWLGGYPPVHIRDVAPQDWYRSYVATYLERDVRQVLDVRDISLFQKFLRACAARSGQLLNLSGLAADLGISHSTARQWLTVLEASYVVHLLPPYHRNFGKRLVKTPKLHFVDTGLAAWLLDIRSARELQVHPMRGVLFESWVIGELRKHLLHLGESANVFFWRDSAGHEVDAVWDKGAEMVAIEAKSGQTVASDAWKGLAQWRKVAGLAGGREWLVHGGAEGRPVGDDAAVAWSAWPGVLAR
ncbi:MAG: ATP-binding protein [Myxococcota bacterium]